MMKLNVYLQNDTYTSKILDVPLNYELISIVNIIPLLFRKFWSIGWTKE